ncbi:RsiV family protein [Chryseobacterium sp. CT-SW4]|uniref:RsiV family protein n=1 Tax=Chryseobacterium sp. SW-1 TaxID=3157343 RepID=UPI003B025BDB
MKNTIAVLAFIFLVLSACKKSENRPQEITKDSAQVKQPEKWAVDSVIVDDSSKIANTLTGKYYNKLLVFPLIKDQTLLDSIYSGYKGINEYSKDGLKNYLDKDKKEYFDSLEKDMASFTKEEAQPFSGQEWYTSSSMDLKSTANDYMHIQYAVGSYAGGAHGNYGFFDKVFDLKNNKRLTLKDITTTSKKDLEEKLMKNINTVHSGTTDSSGEVKNSEMLLVDVIPATDNFYFDDKNLYFHYSPYEIAAYAAGDIIIPVSWEELKGTLNPEFKERMKIK